MRIGIRLNTRTSGGGTVFYRELIAALAEDPACTQVVVFTFGDEAPWPMPGGVDVVRVSTSASRISEATLRRSALTRAAQDHPVDALFCLGTRVSRIPGVPSILWPTTVAPFEPDAIRALGHTPLNRARWVALREAMRSSCRSADAVVFASETARMLFLDAVPGLGALPSTTIGFAGSLVPGRATAAAELPGGGVPYFLFVSHLYRYKMVVELIEAYAISAADPRFAPNLLLAGSAPDAGYLELVTAAIRAHHLEERVLLLGGVSEPQLDALYGGALAFVFPSLAEIAGSLPLTDAFRYGVPVVCSDRSSMPEACGGAALLFDPFDPPALAGHLSRLAREPGTRADLARRSAARGHGLPAWSDTATATLRFASAVAADYGRAPHDTPAGRVRARAKRLSRDLRPRVKGIVDKALARGGFTLLRTRTHEALVEQLHEGMVHWCFPGLTPRRGRVQLMCELQGTPPAEAMYLVHHLEEALGLPGDVCEFGVAQGMTSALIANEIRDSSRTLWLFDSFEGLPRPTDKDVLIGDVSGLGSMDAYEGAMTFGAGQVTRRLSRIGFPSDRVRIVPGFIVPGEPVANFPKEICFAYVDFDLYEPISSVLALVHPSMGAGATIVVDDYGHFSSGAQAAVEEFLAAHAGQYEMTLPPAFAGHFCILRRTTADASPAAGRVAAVLC